jgi:hypothetical protein
MTEQTEMLVTNWQFHTSENELENLTNITTLNVMKKRAPTKKGIACRLSCRFVSGNQPVLDYVAEHSYVIDLADIIDKNELLKMIRNSFSNFTEKFDFRKLGTILQNEHLSPLDENYINLDPIIPLLV